MEYQVYWKPWNGVGLESLLLMEQDNQIVAQSVLIGVKDRVPFQFKYEIVCDRTWHMQTAILELLYNNMPIIKLHTDGEGNWTDAIGQPLPTLAGCYEVDISATPFTNTLPIRRLDMVPGQVCHLAVVYIAVPAMKIRPVQQRYTCLDRTAEGGRYLYEGLFRGFTAELQVDANGLVIDYPDTFRRVQPHAALEDEER